MVDQAGFEPAASALRRQRSSGLIYWPIWRFKLDSGYNCFHLESFRCLLEPYSIFTMKIYIC